MPDSGEASSGRSFASAWVERVLAGLIGIAVSVAAALIVSRFQAREPHVVYTAAQTLPFSGPKDTLGVYHVTVSNDGKVEVQDIRVVVRIPGAVVQQDKINADRSLKYEASIEGDAVEISTPDLNPNESIEISALASKPGDLPLQPEVSVRGKGVTGELAANRQTPEVRLGVAFSIVALAAVSISAVLTSIFRIRGKPNRGGDQRQVLAYICRLQGLNELADEYLDRTSPTFYWAEADKLGLLASASATSDVREKIKVVLQDLLDYPTVMSDTARAVVFFNLARIAKLENNEKSFQENLEKSKRLFRAEIDARLKLDPLFKEDAADAAVT